MALSCGRVGYDQLPILSAECELVTCSMQGTCFVGTLGQPKCTCNVGFINDGPTKCIAEPEPVPCTVDTDCDDDNPCTDDSCDAFCVNAAISGGVTCDDGVGCGQCWSGVCQSRSALGTTLNFDSDAGGVPDGFGVGTGFTHLIPSTGGGYVPDAVILGEVPGALSITTNEGDFAKRSSGPQNDQDNPLALLIDGTGGQELRVAARFVGPWDLADNYQSAGVLFGLDEDNYVKLVLMHNSSAFGGSENDDVTRAGFQLGIERTSDPGKIVENNYSYPGVDGVQSVSTLDVVLEVDTATEVATACYVIDGGAPVFLATLSIAPDVTLFNQCTFAGVGHTNNDFSTAPGGDPNNSPWHPNFDRFSVSLADTDGDMMTLCGGDMDELVP